MGSFGLHELDLDRHGTSLIYPGNATAGERFQSKQGHGI